MIKIGNYTSAEEVFESSAGLSFNFRAPVEDIPAIMEAFKDATSVDFKIAGNERILFSPALDVIQILPAKDGEQPKAVVVFVAAQLPEDKSAEVDELKAQLSEALEQIATLRAAVEEALGE